MFDLLKNGTRLSILFLVSFGLFAATFCFLSCVAMLFEFSGINMAAYRFISPFVWFISLITALFFWLKRMEAGKKLTLSVWIFSFYMFCAEYATVWIAIESLEINASLLLEGPSLQLLYTINRLYREFCYARSFKHFPYYILQPNERTIHSVTINLYAVVVFVLYVLVATRRRREAR